MLQEGAQNRLFDLYPVVGPATVTQYQRGFVRLPQFHQYARRRRGQVDQIAGFELLQMPVGVHRPGGNTLPVQTAATPSPAKADPSKG